MKQMCERAFGTVEEISDHVFEMTNKIKIPRAMSEGTGPWAPKQPEADTSEMAPPPEEVAATPARASFFQATDKLELLKDLTTVVTTKRLVKRMPERGQLNIVTTHNDQLESTTWLVVHKAPLRIELWCVSNDSRHLAGRVERNLLQDYVNALVKRAEGKDGWFF
mmetsp:Transcript_45177/g.104447  ORF Transcript_45177/g.104447 Transcript_45177/m.104447 type:complete len:165 (+) Transcript_45177:268-762(+)